MYITIKIDCDNAAFDDAPALEIARILRKLATFVADAGPDYVALHDVNGNKVGEYCVSD